MKQPTSQDRWEDTTPKLISIATTGTGTVGCNGEEISQHVPKDEPPAADTEPRNEDETDLREEGWNTPFGATRKTERPEKKDILRIATYNINGFPKMH